MAFWTGFVSKIFGGGKIVEKAADLIDKAAYTGQEQSQDDRKETTEARTTPLAPSHESWFDTLVDGISRIPRPFLIFYVSFGVMGFYQLPDPDKMNAYWLTVFERILYFVFGSRFVAKDLPNVIMAIRNAVKK
jgi:hypothetical protein